MAGFRPLIVGLLLAGLFAYALINAGLLIAINNNPSQTIGNDESLSDYKDSLESNLQESYANSNSSEESFSKSPLSLSNIIVVDAIGGVWKSIKIIPVAIYNLTIGILIQKLFSSQEFSIALSVIGAILIITFVLLAWKLLSTGESER